MQWKIIALVAVIGFSMAACEDVNGNTELPPATTTYTITYNGNGNTGGSVPTDNTPYPSGTSVTVLGNNGNLIKTGNTFAGWNTAANGSGASRNAGSTFTIYANTTLYAQWSSNTEPPPPPAHSLNGIWESSNGMQITINGSTGIFSKFFTTPDDLTQSAIDKGYWKIGGQFWRNITSTGSLTWSGQELYISMNNAAPTVATGTTWTNITFTMSANGQTIVADGMTFTRSSYSLNGVWESSNGMQITINGSTGIFRKFFTKPDDLTQSAIDKGYWKIGGQFWRNITSTGNLTWSGQELYISMNNAAPTVATGTTWTNITFTMSANGQSIVADGMTFTRKQ